MLFIVSLASHTETVMYHVTLLTKEDWLSPRSIPSLSMFPMEKTKLCYDLLQAKQYVAFLLKDVS